MEAAYRANETRKFYEKVNHSRGYCVPQAGACTDAEGNLLANEREVIERWKQFYETHFNGGTTAHEGGIGATLGDRGHDDMFLAPSLNEVQEEIKRLRNNKAAGNDQIPCELLKYCGETLANTLHWTICRIWEGEELPQEWMEGVVWPIYKKGDKLECSNYRPITVLNTAYKILSQLLFRRLSPLAKDFVGSYQAGFTDSRATTDQIFALQQILQKCREYNVPTHHLFIDFKAAYDSIDREELWQIMHEYGFLNKLTRLIKATVQRVVCYVRVSGVLSNPFESRKGLRQGDGSSCLLFNIALEGVIRRAAKTVQLISFADDIDIIARNLRNYQ